MKIQINEERGCVREYTARITEAYDAGNDKLCEPVVNIRYSVRPTNGWRKEVCLTKRYFSPFTQDSSLVRDIKRILGVSELHGTFELKQLLNRQCRIQIVPGQYLQVLVLPSS